MKICLKNKFLVNENVIERNKNTKLYMKDIPLNDYKNISIKDDFEELCKMFGKTFPEDGKGENQDKIEMNSKVETQEEKEFQIDLRFDKYVKIREYKSSFETVNNHK